jgi:hypothetical protein
MVRLDHDTAAALHFADPLLYAASDNADQRPGDEDAEEGDKQRQNPLSPSDVARHRAGIERAEHALPEVFKERRTFVATERNPSQPEHECADDHGGEGGSSEEQQDCPCPPGKQVVKVVAEPVPQATRLDYRSFCHSERELRLSCNTVSRVSFTCSPYDP